MNLRQLSIGSRLASGFGLILLSASAMLVGVSLSQSGSRATLLATLEQASGQEEQASAMRLALLGSAVSVRNMGLLSKVEEVQKAEVEAKKQRTDYLAIKAKLEASDLGADERALLTRLTETDRQMNLYFKEAVDLAAQFNAEQAAAIITAKIDPLLVSANGELQTFVQQQQAKKRMAVDQATAHNAATERVIAAAAVLVLGLAALMAWRLTVSIVRPLGVAVAAATRVASGDLGTTIAIDGNDESAHLLGALQQMQTSLSRMVSEVREGTQTIDHAASEIAQGNADLSARTEAQASSLQQTASSVETLTDTVRQNAHNAGLANTLSEAAAQQADRGQSVVGEVITTMSAIDESSRKIGDIISVINGIAFQTNILALNAAVEAARAGEQGRGFAVVAAEVRSLSQRTTTASREIEALIRTAVERSQAGSELVVRAGRTMGEVLESVRQVATIVGEISSASREQTNGIEEVNKAISDIDRSTQQNAALVEQAAAAAESMRAQSTRLSGLVSAFKVQAA